LDLGIFNTQINNAYAKIKTLHSCHNTKYRNLFRFLYTLSILFVSVLYSHLNTVNSEINAWIYYCEFSTTNNNARLINAIGIHVVIEY